MTPKLEGRADGADVAHRQAEQELQALGRLHQRREITDRLGIVDVALEGRVRHREMVAHQPGNQVGFAHAEPQSQAEGLCFARAEFGVVAAAALGDVVEQRREQHKGGEALAYTIKLTNANIASIRLLVDEHVGHGAIALLGMATGN